MIFLKRWSALALLVLLLAGIVGCGVGPAAAGVDVSVDEALQLWQDKAAILIDVRTPAEYQDGHIPGVANIPLAELENRLGEVPKDKKVRDIVSKIVATGDQQQLKSIEYLQADGDRSVMVVEPLSNQ